MQCLMKIVSRIRKLKSIDRLNPNIKVKKIVLFISILATFISCDSRKERTEISNISIHNIESLNFINKKHPSHRIGNSTEKAFSDTIFFSYNQTHFDIYQDTIFFEKSAERELYFNKCKIYLNGKEIFCYGNVAAFEQVLYV